jgi:hypothetical protein
MPALTLGPHFRDHHKNAVAPDGVRANPAPPPVLPAVEKQQAANPWFFILSFNYTMSDSFAPSDGKLSIMPDQARPRNFCS